MLFAPFALTRGVQDEYTYSFAWPNGTEIAKSQVSQVCIFVVVLEIFILCV